MTPAPTFTYWDDDDQGPIADHLHQWRGHFPAHRAVGPDEARAALVAVAPQAGDLFDRIRIPACRSDLARLALLIRDGGLYVDAHCRIDDPQGVQRYLDLLKWVEAVVSTRWAPNFGKIMPFNGVLWARRNSNVIRALLHVAVSRLAEQAARERDGFHPYHVWALTGPGVLWDTLFQSDRMDGALKVDLATPIETVFETDNPVMRHVFVQYRSLGGHWYERQQSERLFEAQSGP